MSEKSSSHPTEALTVVPPTDALALIREPDVLLAEAVRAAQALKKVIDAKPKKVTFNGKAYLENEDWQTVGRFYGVTVKIRSTRYVSFGDDEYRVHGYEATAEALLVATGQIISAADSMCLNDEKNWHGKPLFQLRSMAQTRAASRVLRQVLGHVVVLAGYSPTPAEEMEPDSSQPSPVQRKSQSSGGMVGQVLISQPQLNRLLKIAESHGVPREELAKYVKSLGFNSFEAITRDKYDQVCDWAQGVAAGEAAS